MKLNAVYAAAADALCKTWERSVKIEEAYFNQVLYEYPGEKLL